ncbi:hypothetical protein DM02DRAFT_612697 [Periconia macrospinosa]|uniref:Urease accessory protein UreF n=1 Tax=Periconia macrospinosa TaxID=97972 RepID=A0A2V1DZA9_9PLEO|nr:hypothetical protein DM02DRAFT_612697 [Periconia macrospinosa]
MTTGLEAEIAELEIRLHHARSRLGASEASSNASLPQPSTLGKDETPCPCPLPTNASLHALLLLSDSALPLGSFAFSSGLESYLAHQKLQASGSTPASSASGIPSFFAFLQLSLSTLAGTALPYVLAGYRHPERIEELDNDFDASTPCTVARRASVAQGRALLTVWERSYRAEYMHVHMDDCMDKQAEQRAADVLSAFSKQIRTSDEVHAHLAPLWGVVTRALAVPLQDAAYLFLFSHARTITSAAVRASVMGPYQAQAVLAGSDLQRRIGGLVQDGWDTRIEDAGQSVPVMDLWVGRHEKLYSRIFNS